MAKSKKEQKAWEQYLKDLDKEWSSCSCWNPGKCSHKKKR